VVSEDLLKAKPKSKAKSARKIAKKWEHDERLETIQPFLKEFSRWRSFYVGVPDDWEPKNDGQITCIENIIATVNKYDLDLGLFLGCQFKALAWKPATPTVQQIQSYGLEKYREYADDVLNDVDMSAGADY